MILQKVSLKNDRHKKVRHFLDSFTFEYLIIFNYDINSGHKNKLKHNFLLKVMKKESPGKISNSDGT